MGGYAGHYMPEFNVLVTPTKEAIHGPVAGFQVGVSATATVTITIDNYNLTSAD